MEALVALVVRQVRTTWSPAVIRVGVAVISAVGAGVTTGGGGGAGGGTGFFLQPATATRATSNATGTSKRFRMFKGLLLPQSQTVSSERSGLPFPYLHPRSTERKAASPVEWGAGVWNWHHLRSEKVLVKVETTSHCGHKPTPTCRSISTLQRKLCLIIGNATIIMHKTGNLHRHSNARMLVWPRMAHFQLQFGMKLFPMWVNCCCWVPSASIDQICVRPSISRSKTIWRPSGDHDGKSLLPEP